MAAKSGNPAKRAQQERTESERRILRDADAQDKRRQEQLANQARSLGIAVNKFRLILSILDTNQNQKEELPDVQALDAIFQVAALDMEELNEYLDERWAKYETLDDLVEVLEGKLRGNEYSLSLEEFYEGRLEAIHTIYGAKPEGGK